MRGWLFAASLCLSIVAVSAVRPSSALTQTTQNDHLSERVQRATGLYISGPYVRMHGVEGVIGMLRRARMDTAVVDFKDGMGRVLYDSSLPEPAPSEPGHTQGPRPPNQRWLAAAFDVALVVRYVPQSSHSIRSVAP